MALSAEIQASLKPVWTPFEGSVRRASGQWRLWALGPKPSEGSWYPREAGWVWKWLVPHRSDHGDWLWRGEEPSWGYAPDFNGEAWRLVSSKPLLEWVEFDAQDQRVEPSYRRVWTEQDDLLCFQSAEDQEVLQFMALLRAGKYGTDRTRIVLEDDSDEKSLYDQILQRMKDRGELLPQGVLDSAAMTGPPGQHFALLSEELRSAVESDPITALQWAADELALQLGMSTKSRIEAFLRFLSLGFGASAVEYLPAEPLQMELGQRVMSLSRGAASQRFTEIRGAEGVIRFFWETAQPESVERTAVFESLGALLRSGGGR